MPVKKRGGLASALVSCCFIHLPRLHQADPVHESAEDINRSKLVFCNYFSCHPLMAVSTEKVAMKFIGPRLGRQDGNPVGLSRFNGQPNAPEVRDRETMDPVKRGEFENDRDACLDFYYIRVVFEFFRRDLDHLFRLFRLIRPRRHDGEGYHHERSEDHDHAF